MNYTTTASSTGSFTTYTSTTTAYPSFTYQDVINAVRQLRDATYGAGYTFASFAAQVDVIKRMCGKDIEFVYYDDWEDEDEDSEELTEFLDQFAIKK